MNSYIHYLNGKFVKEEELLISPRDLGFSRGYGVAEFLVTHNLKPFKLKVHIERFLNSAKIIGINVPWSREEIESWILETLSKNNDLGEKTIKMFLTGGISTYMHQVGDPTIIIIIGKYIHQPPSYYERGVIAKSVKYKRQFPQAKTTNYIEAIRNLSLAKNDEFTEVIYFDEIQVYEGGGCNLFAVIDNKLITPQTGILKGITRNTLLEILKLDIEIEECDFTFDQLLNASEIFLTGSSKEVRGVVKIDNKVINDGKVGKITKEVIRQYKEYTSKN